MTTRESILALAKNLIQQQGYNAFSFNDISRPLQIKNAAVHYHFATKEALGCAVVEEERRRVAQWAAATCHLSYPERLGQFFEIYQNNLINNRICMVGSLSSDYMAIPEGMREHVLALIHDVSGWLTQLLLYGREAGAFSFTGSAEDKAAVVVASLAAGVQIARVTGPEHFERIKNQIKLDLTS